AGIGLLGGGHGILEIEDERVSRQPNRLVQEFFAIGRDVEKAARKRHGPLSSRVFSAVATPRPEPLPSPSPGASPLPPPDPGSPPANSRALRAPPRSARPAWVHAGRLRARDGRRGRDCGWCASCLNADARPPASRLGR